MAKTPANTALRNAFVGHGVDLMRVSEATRQNILPYLEVLKQNLGDAILSADIPGVSRTDWGSRAFRVSRLGARPLQRLRGLLARPVRRLRAPQPVNPPPAPPLAQIVF